jgi:arginase
MTHPYRQVVVLGAPSSIGIRPYDTGAVRHLERAPATLRSNGVIQRLGAIDLGDVTPPQYRDFTRNGHGVRNESELVAYSRQLAARVAGTPGEAFTLLIGGDCSIVLGALLGLRHRYQQPVALAYVDGHADFATPQESITGSAASMDLAMTIGRGDTPLARLDDAGPLVDSRDVVLMGRRDEGETWYGHEALSRSGILDLSTKQIRRMGHAAAVDAAHADENWIGGFSGYTSMPTSSSGKPHAGRRLAAASGPDPEELGQWLQPMIDHPRALGMQLDL